MEGEQFKDYAEKVITLTNASLSEISSLHKYENHLRIGCSDSIYEGHLAPIILEHRRQFPNDALKITIGLSNLLMEQLQSDIFDVIFTYLPMKKSSYHCEVYKQDKMILVTDYYNTMYARGITKQALIAENYLMCNFAPMCRAVHPETYFRATISFHWKSMTVPRSFLFCSVRKAIHSCPQIRHVHS